MALGAIEMERISLGALIIAMGMLVDNAIVVAEGMQISMQQGKSSRDAATEAASKTQIPLLGGDGHRDHGFCRDRAKPRCDG